MRKHGVLGEDLVQHVRHLLLVAALLRLHREAEHRRRQLERPGVHVRVLGRVVQDVVELDLVDLGDGADVARDRLVHLDLRSFRAGGTGGPALIGLRPSPMIELAAGRQAPLVHAEHREAADVRVDLDLEHVRERVLAGIGDRREVGALAVARLGDDVGGRVAFSRVGQELHDHVEQLADSGAALRRGKHHRDEMAFAQRALERLVQLVGAHLALLEVRLHQLLVDLDHLVDELAVRFFHRAEIGLARGREEAVRYPGAAAGRQVERQAFLAERLLDALEQVLQVDVVGIDLVDDDQAIESALRRPAEEAPGHHLDAVLRVDDDRGGLDRGERGQSVPEKVRVARGIQQMDIR